MKLTGYGLVVDWSPTTMSSGRTSPLSLFYTSHFIFLFSSHTLPFRISVHICVYVSLFFLPSLYLAACQIYEVPVCRSTSPSRLPVSHFRLSYFARVAACNLKTSSPGSSSFSLHPTQCSREHHHYTCLSLIKKSGPLCTANPSRQTDSAAPHTDGGI